MEEERAREIAESINLLIGDDHYVSYREVKKEDLPDEIVGIPVTRYISNHWEVYII